MLRCNEHRTPPRHLEGLALPQLVNSRATLARIALLIALQGPHRLGWQAILQAERNSLAAVVDGEAERTIVGDDPKNSDGRVVRVPHEKNTRKAPLVNLGSAAADTAGAPGEHL